MKEFVLTFESGLRCRFYPPEKPTPGGSYNPKIVWDGGNPQPEHFPKYQSWIHEVNMTLAREWKIPLMHVFMHSPTKHEIWTYEPGQPPKPLGSTNQ